MRTLLFILLASRFVFAQPTIATHPAPASVSLGATVTFRVAATGGPLKFQWRRNAENLLNATNASLILTNIALTNAGHYSAIVSNATGFSTSRDATLEVDPAFVKIMTGAIVNDGGDSTSASWIDYDNDGDLDQFISNFSSPQNFLYRNNGDGSFTRIIAGPLATEHLQGEASVWADYDNDGDLDPFISNFGNDFLFRNDSQGNFTRLATGPVATSGGNSRGASWADYDNDGFVDLFVANEQGQKNFLFRNTGTNTFTRVTAGKIVNDIGYSTGCSWADYDNDGDSDLFVANRNLPGFLYRNDRAAGFTRILTGAIATASGQSHGAAWGDYDNDGHLDLFVANFAQKSFLFHNNGDGTFTRVTAGAIVNDIGDSWGCAWADYDNDGWLDLFVCNGNTTGTNNDFLYRNNGDGTFQKITSGSLVNDGEIGDACAWGDYNKDGFLDLMVANWNGQNNRLYRNGGNSNQWLIVKCAGRISNRAAIGARLEVVATINGRRAMQAREISGGGGYNSQNSLEAHFGLGDAAQADEVLIRWPSGITQRLGVVTAGQYIHVREPARLSAARHVEGEWTVTLESDAASRFQLQSTTDFSTWAESAPSISAGPVTIKTTNTLQFFRARDLP